MVTNHQLFITRRVVHIKINLPERQSVDNLQFTEEVVKIN